MSTQVSAKRRQQRYTEETIERGLRELAFCGGNERQASDRLANEGIDIPHPTLRRWMTTTHPERYQIAREQISEHLAQQNEQLARQYAEAEAKLLARLTAESDDLATKELPGAVKNLGIGRGISVSRAIELRGGNPIRLDVQLTADEALKQLAALAPGVVRYQPAIDTTAEEDTEPLAAQAEQSALNARAQLEPPAVS